MRRMRKSARRGQSPGWSQRPPPTKRKKRKPHDRAGASALMKAFSTEDGKALLGLCTVPMEDAEIHCANLMENARITLTKYVCPGLVSQRMQEKDAEEKKGKGKGKELNEAEAKVQRALESERNRQAFLSRVSPTASFTPCQPVTSVLVTSSGQSNPPTAADREAERLREWNRKIEMQRKRQAIRAACVRELEQHVPFHVRDVSGTSAGNLSPEVSAALEHLKDSFGVVYRGYVAHPGGVGGAARSRGSKGEGMMSTGGLPVLVIEVFGHLAYRNKIRKCLLGDKRKPLSSPSGKADLSATDRERENRFGCLNYECLHEDNKGGRDDLTAAVRDAVRLQNKRREERKSGVRPNPYAPSRATNPGTNFGEDRSSTTSDPLDGHDLQTLRIVAEKDGENLEAKDLDSLFPTGFDFGELPVMEPASAIVTKMKRYQKQGLSWMIMREKALTLEEGGVCIFWRRDRMFAGASSRVVYRNTESDQVRFAPPTQNQGGFLCDEMGLGKTLQVIALILSNPMTAKDQGDALAARYRSTPWTVSRGNVDLAKQKHCPSALVNGRRREYAGKNNSVVSPMERLCKTTLIVCPLTLISNWEDQISNHVEEGGLSVYVYHGPDRIKDPSYLAGFDVVISTYGTISTEFSRWLEKVCNARQAQLERQRKAQNRGPGRSGLMSRMGGGLRFEMAESIDNSKADFPLLWMNWFRIVLDESHVIRTRDTNVSRAISFLHGLHRWCLTGTPMQNRIDDLYAQLRFLRIEPFSSYETWKKLVLSRLKSSAPIDEQKLAIECLTKKILKQLCLRRKKTDQIRGHKVLDLPTKTLVTVNVKLGAEERAFYRSVELYAKERLFHIVAEHGMDGIMREYIHILELLTRLRQATNHPYLVKGEFHQFFDLIKDSILQISSHEQFNDLLNQLRDRVYEDCEEARRLRESRRCVCPEGVIDETLHVQVPSRSHSGLSPSAAGRPGRRGRSNRGGENRQEPDTPACDRAPDEVVESMATVYRRRREDRGSARGSDHNGTGIDPTKLKKIQNLFEELLSSGSVECPVCLEPLVPDRATSSICFHTTCLECHERIGYSHHSDRPCVICRAPLRKKHMFTLAQVKERVRQTRKEPSRQAVESLQRDVEEIERLRAAVQERLEQSGEYGSSYTSQSRVPVSDHVDSKFFMGSKLKCLIRLVKQDLEEEADNKVIVFSQWTSMLDLISLALEREQIMYCRLDGKMQSADRRAALRAFDNEKSLRVFLISIQCGNTGLNLVAANRAYVYDNVWNPAVVDQAVNRIHRLGQTRPVVITSFLVEHSVEERVRELQERKREMMREVFDYSRRRATNVHQERLKDICFLFGELSGSSGGSRRARSSTDASTGEPSFA